MAGRHNMRVYKAFSVLLLITLIFVMTTTSLYSKPFVRNNLPPQRVMTTTWGEGYNESLYGGVIYNNHIILVGTGHDNNNALILISDLNGNVILSRYIDFGGTKEKLWSVTADDDGNFVAVGSAYIGGDSDMVVVKFDINGGIFWQKTYDGGDADHGFSVIYDSSDSTYVVVGESYFEDAYIWKYDKSGTLIWAKDIAPSGYGYDVATDIIKINNFYYVCGYGDYTYNKDFYIEKLNNNGNVLFSYSYGTADDDRTGRLTYYNGYLYVSTSVNSLYTRIYNVTLGGTVNWAKDFNEDYKTILRASTNNQKLLLTGYIQDSYGNSKIHLAEIDSNGNILWETNDSIAALVGKAIWLNNNTFYVCGSINNLTDHTTDALWVEYSWTYNDTEPPTVNILQPSEGALTNSTVKVVWNGSDNVGIEHYEISDGGAVWINVSLNTEYTFSGLSEGSHRIYVRAYDYSGNYGEDSVNITVDSSPPSLKIILPEEGSFQNSDVDLKWNCTDNYGIDHYEVSDGGGVWINVGTSTNYTFTGLSQGYHTLYVKAYDLVNNVAMASVNITVDTYIPKVYIITPPNNEWFNTTEINVVWAASDDNGIDHFEVSSDGSNWINVDNATNYIFTNLSEGENILYVKAVDVAGNVGMDYVRIHIDTTPPMVNITNPSSEFISERNVTLEWIMDDNAGINKCEVSDGHYWIDVGITTSYTFTNLDEGIYNLSVRVTDFAGNVYTDSVRIVIDLTPPKISVSSPQSYFINTSNVSVCWNMYDNFGISAVYLRVDNSSWITVNSTHYTLHSLQDGKHRVEIKVVDLAGNVALNSTEFIMDTVPPTLYITEPLGMWLNKSNVYIKWVCKDISGIYTQMLRVDNEEWIYLQPNVREYLLQISEGTHTIQIRAVDNAGNAKEVIQNMMIDITSPDVNISISKDYVVINATDNLSGISKIIYSIDGQEWEKYTGKIPIKNIKPGEHNITVIAEDNAGNKVTITKTFFVEIKTKPYQPIGNNCFIPILLLLIIIMVLAAILLITVLHYRKRIAALQNLPPTQTQEQIQQEPKENKEVDENEKN